MLVKRAGHPDGVVRINAADFDPSTETRWEPAPAPAPGKPAEPAPEPAPGKPAKPGRGR